MYLNPYNVGFRVKVKEEEEERKWACCLFIVFKNCFLLSKTRKIGKTCLVSVFFFFSLKNRKNTIFKEQRRVFKKHLFGVFCVFQKQFSKTILKNRNKKDPSLLHMPM